MQRGARRVVAKDRDNDVELERRIAGSGERRMAGSGKEEWQATVKDGKIEQEQRTTRERAKDGRRSER